MTIYNSMGNPKVKISPNDSSTHVKEVQGDSILTLSFTHYDYIELDVDDYAEFLGERFWLTEKYRPKQNSKREWVYDLKLYGVESMIKRLLVIKTVDDEEDPVFTLTAPPRDHVAMIVKCMNNGMGNITDWKVGQVNGTENIVIDYFGKYCDEALKEIAEKVGAEWWVEGQTVNICKCEHGDSIHLGYNNGLISIEPDTADNVKFYTRLYPIGSSRNIDREKYGHARLQLPGGAKYVEINADKYSRVDHYEADAFAAIYPRRIGTVSSVRSEVKTGEDGNPFTIYHFADRDLPFDPNDYEIAGLVKRVSFQEGSELAGLGDEDNGTYYFEVNFNSETREFEIITIWPYDNDVQLPGDKLVPEVGDKYILWNIAMPNEYYALAEEEFLTAVNAYNANHNLDISVYKAPTDHVWVEDNAIELSIGQRVRLESENYFPETGFRESRITKITRNVNLPSSMDIEVSDALSRTSQQKISDSIEDVRNYAKSIGESTGLPDIIRTGDKTAPTDNNLFSARRSSREFLSKSTEDRAKKKITFDEGVAFGDYIKGENGGIIDGEGDAELLSLLLRQGLKIGTYIAGLSGAYFGIEPTTGRSYLEVDKLYVRIKALFEQLMVIKAGALAGKQYITPGGGVRFTEVVDRGSSYQCWFLSEQDGEKIDIMIQPGDAVICKTFNAREGVTNNISNRFYWRAVNSVVVDARTDAATGNHYGYMDISKTNCAADSDAPQAGDEVVQLGTCSMSTGNIDPDRTTAIILSTVDSDEPSIKLYTGINNFNFDGCEIVAYGYDKQTARAYFRCYGDTYIGAPDGSSFVKYDAGLRELEIKARINAQSPVGNTGKTILQYVDAAAEAVRSELQKQIDGVVQSYSFAYSPTLDNAPAKDWSDEEKAAHAGDVFFNISTEGEDAGKAWRWSPDDEDFKGWHWHPIADTDAVKALQLASQSVLETDVYFTRSATTPLKPMLALDGTIANFNGWQTQAPARKDGEYIWQITYTRYGDGRATFSDPVNISGSDGKGIDKLTEQYYLSTSRTQCIGSDEGWVDKAPTWEAGKYIWTRTFIEYTDGTSDYTDPICATGATGAAGSSVYARYSANGTAWHATFQSGDIWMQTSTDNVNWSAAIRIVGEKGADGAAGKDGQYTIMQWATSASSITAPTGGWADTPPTSVAAGQYVWMRTGIIVPPSTTATWGNPVRLTGDKGNDGQSVYLLDLSNEVAGIACNSSGTAASGQLPITSTVTVYKGGSVDDSWSGSDFSLTTRNCTASISGNTLSVTAISADTASVEVTATKYGVTLTATMNLYKVKPGANGSTTYVYQLEPSVNNITRSMTGELSASSVTVTTYRASGTSRAISTAYTLRYRRIPDMADFATLSRTSGVSAAVQILPDTEAVIFEYVNGSTILDRERIPVITDAADMELGGTNLARRTATECYIDWIVEGLAEAANQCVSTGYPVYGLKAGDTFTLSFDWEGNGIAGTASLGSRIAVQFPNYGYLGADILTVADPLDKASGRFKKTFTIPATSAVTEATNGWIQLRFDYIYDYSDPAMFAIRNLKVEKGNVATAWSPAPEDIATQVTERFDYLTEAMKGNTTIDGGLLLSSLIKLGRWQASADDSTKAEITDVRAGMNGIYQNPRTIASWWGGDMVDIFDAEGNKLAQLPANAAAALVRMDGTGYFSGGTIVMNDSEVLLGDNLHLSDQELALEVDGKKHFVVSGAPTGFSSVSDIAATKTESFKRSLSITAYWYSPTSQSSYFAPMFNTFTLALGDLGAGAQVKIDALALQFYLTIGTGAGTVMPTLYGGVKFELINAAGTVVASRTCGYGKQLTDSSTNTYRYYLNYLTSGNWTMAVSTAGTYRLRISSYDTAKDQGSNGSGFVSTTNLGVSTFSGTYTRSNATVHITMLGSDGFAASWGQSLLLATADGVGMRYGNTYFRVGSDGIKYSINGAAEKSLA